MADHETPNGGAAGDAGGAASGKAGDSTGDGQDKNQGKEGGGEPTKVVSWQNHKRAIDDLHKFKSENADLRTKLGDIESNALKEKNDFKGLYERESTRAKELEKKYNDTNGYFINTLRSAEVRAAAVSAGLVQKSVEDLDLLDLSDVQVEATSSGKFLVSGAKEFVEKLKNDRPHWFTKPSAPNVNGGGGGTPPAKTGPLTATDVYDAEMKWKAGKMTRDAYVEIHQKFVAQGK